MLKERPEDSFMDIFFREAVYAQSLVDPDTRETTTLFGEYVVNVNTGLNHPLEATRVLSGEIDVLLEKYKF
jgi:hypothetical protein